MAHSLYDHVSTNLSGCFLRNNFYRRRMESSLYNEATKKPPIQPITLAIMVNLIAQMGGYLNRTHDTEPGPTVLWVGLQRLRNFTLAQRVYKQLIE